MRELESLDLDLPDDYVPSNGEMNNIVYLACKYGVGWTMREVDFFICLRMAGEIRGLSGIDQLLRVTCEYLLDHVCGEPESPTPKKIFKNIRPILREWYSNTTPDDRSRTT